MSPLNKIILNTAIHGLVWTAVVFSYGLGLFAVIFPGTMAKFYDTVGDKRLSAMYYERVYDRNPSAKNLFFVLEKYISAGNYKKVIKYSEKLFNVDNAEYSNSEYQNYVALVSAHIKERASEEMDDDEFIEIISDIDGRLRCAYIEALINRNRESDAKDFFLHSESELSTYYIGYVTDFLNLDTGT